MKERWMEWKPEHLTYFDPDNIQTALLHAGFEQTSCSRVGKFSASITCGAL